MAMFSAYTFQVFFGGGGPLSGSDALVVLFAVWCVNMKRCDLKGGHKDVRRKRQNQGYSTCCSSSICIFLFIPFLRDFICQLFCVLQSRLC